MELVLLLGLGAVLGAVLGAGVCGAASLCWRHRPWRRRSVFPPLAERRKRRAFPVRAMPAAPALPAAPPQPQIIQNRVEYALGRPNLLEVWGRVGAAVERSRERAREHEERRQANHRQALALRAPSPDDEYNTQPDGPPVTVRVWVADASGRIGTKRRRSRTRQVDVP